MLILNEQTLASRRYFFPITAPFSQENCELDFQNGARPMETNREKIQEFLKVKLLESYELENICALKSRFIKI